MTDDNPTVPSACRPPDDRAKRRGWYWLETSTHGPVACLWRQHRGIQDAWAWHYENGIKMLDAVIVLGGWRCLGPILTPADVEAERMKARKAALEDCRDGIEELIAKC